MKRLLVIVVFIFCCTLYGQVGIGTPTPRGALDINKPLTNTHGLVLPTNASPANMQNPQGGSVPPGTIMYDSTEDCVKLYKQSLNGGAAGWSDCLQSGSSSSVVADCNAAGNGFSGGYKKGTAMTAGNTFKVTLTNNSFSQVTIALDSTDLTLSGVAGITVASVNPTSVTLTAGQSEIITYTLSGTPTVCGTLTGNWQKINLNCTKTIAVAPNPTIDCANGTWSTAVSPDYKLNGLINGQAYSGTYSVAYTNGECSLPADVVTSNGLTLTYAGGPLSASGTINYVLSGTYTGTNNGSVTFTMASGCSIYLGPCTSCKQILDLGLANTDGVYWIDPDQVGITYAPMRAQCDMTTDGGGWTLILNYLHLGGTSPGTSIRTTLPIIGSSTLGTDESGNTDFWGNAGRALQVALNPSEYRFYGITNSHPRVMHFKTSHVGSLTYFKTGVGNATGIQSSFTPLTGHTTNLPGNAVDFYGGVASGRELTEFPFYVAARNHWGIGAINRWEMDDFPNNNSRNTLHRVWIR
ncbi:fibrinogen-like YCDxxxxGGGW domain-containing protein [Chryseobacterium limigenitum]|uniref:fibrinogen-like YCDxxxxGGGW domain-containing protein n=1 Tax=Chryseobacterium limigenitum TaxID=1612149 RepID=UPI001114BA5A